MSQNDLEKQAIAKYTMGKEPITDLGEAVSLLNIHGEKCEMAIDDSIRKEAWLIYNENK